MSTPLDTFRTELTASATAVAHLEQAVKAAQERLRLAMDKADRLRGLIAVYEAEEGVADPGPTLPEPVGISASANIPGTGKIEVTAEVSPSLVNRVLLATTKKDKLDIAITDLLQLRGAVHRQVLLEHLKNMGLMGQEKNPLAQLAAFLSEMREKFMSDGKGNFSLRRGEAVERPKSPNGSGAHLPAAGGAE